MKILKKHLEPCFVGRVDVGVDGTGKAENFRVHSAQSRACFVPAPADRYSDDPDTDGEAGWTQEIEKYYEYEVLRVSCYYFLLFSRLNLM